MFFFELTLTPAPKERGTIQTNQPVNLHAVNHDALFCMADPFAATTTATTTATLDLARTRARKGLRKRREGDSPERGAHLVTWSFSGYLSMAPIGMVLSTS